MRKKQFLIFFILWCHISAATAQNTIGLPAVNNYNKQQYKGGLQNWALTQDKNKVLYTANNEGLITFDGDNWQSFPLPNQTIVRSVCIGYDQRIYVGGQDEIGYFTPNPSGMLSYHSLFEKLPIKYRSLADVWNIVSYNNNIFFRSTQVVLQFADGKFIPHNPFSEWEFLGSANGKLYAQDKNDGLYIYINGQFTKLSQQSNLPKGIPVTAVLPLSMGEELVCTLSAGIFIKNKTEIRHLPTSHNFSADKIYAATIVENGRIALATTNAGVIIINETGEVIQQVSTAEGLSNNNVLSIKADHEKNLWLGLDNGLAYISYNSAIKQIDPLRQKGSGYSSTFFNNKLYLGTTNGLFATEVENLPDFSFSKNPMRQVSNTSGQVWKIANINDKLLLGKHEGFYEVVDYNATSIAQGNGYWNFGRLADKPIIVAGTYRGLISYSLAGNERSEDSVINGFKESSRYLAVDADNNIWVSHPYHGVFKVKSGLKSAYKKYGVAQGLPFDIDNYIFKISNQILAATKQGIYKYNLPSDRFMPEEELLSTLGKLSIRYLQESPRGNIWFVHDKSVGVIDQQNDKLQLVWISALKGKILSGFENINCIDEANVIIGGEKGFYHVNYAKYKAGLQSLIVQVRSVHIINEQDSLLFGGYFRGVNDQPQQNSVPSISHHWKTIRFRYSAISYAQQGELSYCYRLTGYEKEWQEWSNRTEKEYTNLPGGTYTFEVKVKDALGKESVVSSYKFVVRPPWYMSLTAKIIYFLLFLIGNYMAYRYLKEKFKMQELKHKKEQERLVYIYELEKKQAEATLIEVENEKLAADLSFKNAELASSAMHLVTKGELLTKVKKELTHVSKEIRNPEAVKEIKKLIKKVGDDDKLNEEWETFSKHFDAVHSEYLTNLKAKHPNLTSSELKLCANLRMNLSSKEIAQLMNISVRGVEISRYRLRKKLGLETETNLFDYLMGV